MSTDLRSLFPFLTDHPDLVYLDAAAATPVPAPVVEAVRRHLVEGFAAPVPGSHRPAGAAAAAVESVRAGAAAFLGLPDADRVAFTGGTTAAMDLLARRWGADHLGSGDEVLLSPADHPATTGPWRRLAATHGLRLVGYRLTASGDPDLADLAARITPRTRVAVVTHVHNVFGERASVPEIRRLLGPAPLLVLDAAQSAGRVRLDAPSLGVDALAFSGHKLFAPPGTGVLALSPRLHEALAAAPDGGPFPGPAGPFPDPGQGAPNTAGLAGLGAALDLLADVGVDNLHTDLSALTRGLVDRLRGIPGIELLPGVAYSTACTHGYGIVSFRVAGVSAADVVFVLDDAGICVRAFPRPGHGAPAERADGAPAPEPLREPAPEPVPNAVRVAAHAYTTPAELDRLADVLHRIRRYDRSGPGR